MTGASFRKAVTGTSFRSIMRSLSIYGDKGAFASANEVPVTAFVQAYRTKLEAQDAAAAGDTEGALRMYNDLASAGLAEEEDFLAAGSLYLGVGNFERAYRWYEQILESNPYQREALDGLAEAAEGIGQEDAANQARARADLLAWPCSVD